MNGIEKVGEKHQLHYANPCHSTNFAHNLQETTPPTSPAIYPFCMYTFAAVAVSSTMPPTAAVGQHIAHTNIKKLPITSFISIYLCRSGCKCNTPRNCAAAVSSVRTEQKSSKNKPKKKLFFFIIFHFVALLLPLSAYAHVSFQHKYPFRFLVHQKCYLHPFYVWNGCAIVCMVLFV